MYKSIKLNWTLFRLLNEKHLQDAFDKMCNELVPLIEVSRYFPQIENEPIKFFPLYIKNNTTISYSLQIAKKHILSLIESGFLVCILSNKEVSISIPKEIDSKKCLFLCGQRLLKLIEDLQESDIKNAVLKKYFLDDEIFFTEPISNDEKYRFISLFFEFEKDALIEKRSMRLTDSFTNWEKIATHLLNIIYDLDLEQTQKKAFSIHLLDLVDKKKRIGVEVVSSYRNFHSRSEQVISKLLNSDEKDHFEQIWFFVLDMPNTIIKKRNEEYKSEYCIKKNIKIEVFDFDRLLCDLSDYTVSDVFDILCQESHKTASDFATYFYNNCDLNSNLPRGILEICKRFQLKVREIENIDEAIYKIVHYIYLNPTIYINNGLEIVDILLSLLNYKDWSSWTKNLKTEALRLYYSCLWIVSTPSFYNTHRSKYSDILYRYSKNISLELFEDIMKYSLNLSNGGFSGMNIPLIMEIIYSLDILQTEKDQLLYKYITVNQLGQVIYDSLSEWIDNRYGDFHLVRNVQFEKEIVLQENERLLGVYSQTHTEDLLYMVQQSSSLIESFQILHKSPNSKRIIHAVSIQLVDIPTKVLITSNDTQLELIINPNKTGVSLSILRKWLSDNADSIYQAGSGFELIYLYAENLHDLKPQEIKFSSPFDISYDFEKKIVVVEKSPKPWVPQPSDFYGNAVTNICAVVGRNGSGKSSLFDLFSNCPMFNTNAKQYNSKYFMIYRLHSKYYYSTWGINPTVQNNQDIEIFPYQIFRDTTLIKISNVFDSFTFVKGLSDEWNTTKGTEENLINVNNLLDLSTYSLMCKAKSWNEYYEAEKARYNNYKAFAQRNYSKSKKGTDKYQVKLIHDVTDDISSGERARLILFSRLLSVFIVAKKYAEHLPLLPQNQNYILMLDEAELYFHPEWQRNLINDLCTFLADIKKKLDYPFDNMTILLSSNSPFYMSDLPGDYVQALGKASFDKTFGQNIYNLLKDRFFMEENDVVGEFAQNKINKAFDYLYEARITNSKTTSQPIASNDLNLNYYEKDFSDEEKNRLQEIKYIISILGDPLTKRLLLDQMIELGIDCDEE